MTHEEFVNAINRVFPGYDWWTVQSTEPGWLLASSCACDGLLVLYEGDRQRWGMAKSPEGNDDYVWAESLEELRRR